MSTDNGTSDTRQVTERAAAFATKAFSGKASEQDSLALDLWLTKDEQHKEEYQGVLDAWGLVEGLASRVDELEEKPKTRIWPKVWAMAALVLISATVGLSYFAFTGSETVPVKYLSYVTYTGEQKTVELNDGSTMTLNTNTRVLVDFNEQKRRLILDRGEVFLEVAKEVERPFVVDAGARSVTVLGTVFNVHRSGFDLNVGVVDGVVAVHRGDSPVNTGTEMVDTNPVGGNTPKSSSTAYRISAGIKVLFSGTLGAETSTVQAKEIANSDQFPYWSQGMVLFDNQTLSDVVKDLNRYTHKKILIEDAGVMDLRISGMFQLDRVESTVYKLEKLLPITVVAYPDRMVIISK